MAGITQAQAQAKLDEWLAADTAVATRQEYTINGRTLRLSDAAEIRRNIEYWDSKVRALENQALSGATRRGPRVRYIVSGN